MAARAVEFMVMERMECDEIFLYRVVKNEKTLLSFIEANIAQLSGFFFCQRLAKKNFPSDGICKTLNHAGAL